MILYPASKPVSIAKALPLLLCLFATTPARSQPLEIRSPFEEEQSRLGEVVAGIPDFTGDGKGDVAALFHANDHETPEVHLFDGSTGEFLRKLESPVGEGDGKFGHAIAGLSDINGDDLGEVIVAAPLESQQDTPSNQGRVYIFDGSTGQLIKTLFSPNPKTFEGFGDSVSTIPDVSGDGFEDLVIGACSADVGEVESAGAAYIFNPISGAFLKRLVSPNPHNATLFGSSVAGVPDVNGDGLGDVIVGAFIEPHFLNAEGRAYIFDGSSGTLLHPFVSPNRITGGGFGFSVAGIPDVDGDGLGDVVVGAPGERGLSLPNNSVGRAYVFSGSTGDLIRNLVSPNEQSNVRFGESVVGISDFNGDGKIDLAVGEPKGPAGSSTEGGLVYVIDALSGESLETLSSPNETRSVRFGSSLSPILDSKSDGCQDIVVGAQSENPGTSPFRAGRAYLFFSQCGLIMDPRSDINQDGKVDALDLEILVGDWGR